MEQKDNDKNQEIIINDDILNDDIFKDQEETLKKMADKGECFKTMHEKATKKYKLINLWFAIPIILIPVLVGIGVFTFEFYRDYFDSYTDYVIKSVGGSNLLSALLSFVSKYSGTAQKEALHKAGILAWDKLSNKIRSELQKPKSQRQPVKEIVAKSQETYNSIVETTPPIPQDVVKWFDGAIESGELEEESQHMNILCQEFFCFLCSCRTCQCNICNKRNKRKHLKVNLNKTKINDMRQIWKEIGLSTDGRPSLIENIMTPQHEQPEETAIIYPSNIIIDTQALPPGLSSSLPSGLPPAMPKTLGRRASLSIISIQQPSNSSNGTSQVITQNIGPNLNISQSMTPMNSQYPISPMNNGTPSMQRENSRRNSTYHIYRAEHSSQEEEL